MSKSKELLGDINETLRGTEYELDSLSLSGSVSADAVLDIVSRGLYNLRQVLIKAIEDENG